MALTADDWRRRAHSSRLSSLLAPAPGPRVNVPRTPEPPAAGPPLETVPPSKAAEWGMMGKAVTGAAVLGAGMVNPFLGAMVGMIGAAATQHEVSKIASKESERAAGIQKRNRMRLGEARFEEQNYQRKLAEARPTVIPGAQQARMQGPAPGQQILPGGVDKSKSILMGGS